MIGIDISADSYMEEAGNEDRLALKDDITAANHDCGDIYFSGLYEYIKAVLDNCVTKMSEESADIADFMFFQDVTQGKGGEYIR